MKSFGVKINYLYNSGFSVETKRHLMVFDYYLDTVNTGSKGIINGAISLEDLNTDKDIIIFASHSHKDHFNPVILEWGKNREKITYILSSDIVSAEKNSNINMIAPYESMKVGQINVKAYGSTDIGVSFLVNVDGISIFHSGDLNWWHWWDENEEVNKIAEKGFKDEIEKIKEESIDIAFFPVDPRLKQSYALGAELFIDKIKPQVLIPMHFGEKYEITEKFSQEMKDRSTKVIKINRRGQEILL